jgi:hypothetical protein
LADFPDITTDPLNVCSRVIADIETAGSHFHSCRTRIRDLNHSPGSMKSRHEKAPGDAGALSY